MFGESLRIAATQFSSAEPSLAKPPTETIDRRCVASPLPVPATGGWEPGSFLAAQVRLADLQPADSAALLSPSVINAAQQATDLLLRHHLQSPLNFTNAVFREEPGLHIGAVELHRRAMHYLGRPGTTSLGRIHHSSHRSTADLPSNAAAYVADFPLSGDAESMRSQLQKLAKSMRQISPEWHKIDRQLKLLTRVSGTHAGGCSDEQKCIRIVNDCGQYLNFQREGSALLFDQDVDAFDRIADRVLQRHAELCQRFPSLLNSEEGVLLQGDAFVDRVGHLLRTLPEAGQAELLRLIAHDGERISAPFTQRKPSNATDPEVLFKRGLGPQAIVIVHHSKYDFSVEELRSLQAALDGRIDLLDEARRTGLLDALPQESADLRTKAYLFDRHAGTFEDISDALNGAASGQTVKDIVPPYRIRPR